MFCNNCGNEVNPNEVFCTKCGARLIQEENTTGEVNEVVEETVSDVSPEEVQNPATEAPEAENLGANYQMAEETAGTESAGEAFDAPVYTPFDEGHVTPEIIKPPKKGLPKFLIPLILILAIVGGAFAHPITRNSIMKLVMNDEAYFKHVMENNAEDIAEDLSVALVGKDTSIEDGVGGKVDMEVELGQGAKDLVGQYGGSDVKDAISWLNSFGLDYDVRMDEDTFGANMNLKLNKVDITSAKIVANEKGIYVSLPDFSNEAILISADASGMSDFAEAMKAMNSLAEILPEQKVIEEIMVRYIMCVVDSIDNAKEESETIEAGGVSQKCTAVTIEISEDLIADSVESVLKALEDDEDIEKIIKDVASSELVGEDGKEVYKEFQSGIDEALASIDELKDELDFNPFDITFYINNKGELIGFECDIAGETVDMPGNLTLKCYTAESGKKYGALLSLDAAGQGIKFDGGGSLKGKKYNGKHTLSVMGMDILTIELVDVEKKLMEEGTGSGKYIISPAENISGILSMADVPSEVANLLKDLRIEISSKESTKDKATGKIAAYTGKELLASLKVEAEITDNKKFDTPKNYVDANNDSEMSKWAEKAQSKIKVLKDRLEKAGVPSEILSLIN